ncbi:MAG: transcription elongation factor GreA [Candidatus Peribacteria bacterium]|jgi:transcription elongation factor GreA|nr:transcription elongation factor GreA [Candidatus Peribacteria bacterium]
MAQKKFLSREGYEKLVNELQELRQVKLPAVLVTLAESKEMGDLSENFDYKAALEEKDFINSRIKQIEELIEDVEIVDETKKVTGKVVEFGSKVTIQIEDDKPYEVSIVGSGEVNIKEGEFFISLESPLGQAIKGKTVGETVKMRLATMRKDVKILHIQ